MLHLGDIVDGNLTRWQTHEDLDVILQSLSRLTAPVLHVLGNHCLTVDRSRLLDKLQLKAGTYYYRDLAERWRVVVLDTVEICVGRGKDHENHRRALQYMAAHNGEPNAREWNGGLGCKQVEWLEHVLRETKESGRWAVVCGHLPVVVEAALEKATIWERDMLRNVLERYGVVKAYFAGHHHEGGYAKVAGIHHVTFEGLLDAEHDMGAVGVIELGTEMIEIKGHGKLTSRVLDL